MSAPLFSIVEGWNSPLPFSLKLHGIGIDLTGLRVQAVAQDASGLTVFDSSSKLTLTNTTAGELQLEPSSSDFRAVGTPYEFRVRLVTLGNPARVAYVPADEASLVEVNPI